MRKRIEEAEAKLAFYVPEQVQEFVIALKAEIAIRQAEIDGMRARLLAVEGRKAAEKAERRIDRQLDALGPLSADRRAGLKADLLKRELNGGQTATEEPAAPKRGRGRPQGSKNKDQPQRTEEEEAEDARQEQAIAEIQEATSDEVLFPEVPARVDMLLRQNLDPPPLGTFVPVHAGVGSLQDTRETPRRAAVPAAMASPSVSASSARAPEPEPVIPVEAPDEEVPALDAAEDPQAASDEATPADQGEAAPVAASEEGAGDEAAVEPTVPETPAEQGISQQDAEGDARADQDQPAEAVAEPPPLLVTVEDPASAGEPVRNPVEAAPDPEPAAQAAPVPPADPPAQVADEAAPRVPVDSDPQIAALASLVEEMTAYRLLLREVDPHAEKNPGGFGSNPKSHTYRVSGQFTLLRWSLEDSRKAGKLLPISRADMGELLRIMAERDAPAAPAALEARAQIRSRVRVFLAS